ncbi:MAG: porin [Plesiomonas shigelloides]
MKKTILAIAIPALFASAANATVIYDKDGTTFDVYGRVQANYYGEANDNSAELVGTSRLGWKGKVALNDTWSGLARTEWQVAAENSDKNKRKVTVFDKDGNEIGTATVSDEDGKFQARHIYAGFDGSQYGQFLFGQTDTAYYDVLAVTDIFNEWGSVGNTYDGRQEGQAIYRGAWNGLMFNASYQTNDDSQEIDNGFALSTGYTFDFGLGLAAGMERKEFDDNTEKKDWAVSANYAINGFYFAGMYNESDVDGAEGNGFELAATYNVDAWTLLAGYNYAEVKEAGVKSDATDETLLGVGYNFTPKLLAYAEYKIQGISDKDDEFTVALQYNF